MSETTSTMPHLKGCPFCGSLDVVTWESKTFGGWSIECSGCLTVVLPQSENERECRDGWNRRAITDAQ